MPEIRPGGLDYKSGIETLGRISGMAMPLIAFPTLITSSVATTLVPAISEAISVKNYKLANLRISRCLNMGFQMCIRDRTYSVLFPSGSGCEPHPEADL